MRRLSPPPPPRNDAIMVLTVVAVFFAGVTLGGLLCAVHPRRGRNRDGRRPWDRILFGCKRMGPEEVLSRREVLGVVAIDEALSASADYGQ